MQDNYGAIQSVRLSAKLEVEKDKDFIKNLKGNCKLFTFLSEYVKSTK